MFRMNRHWLGVVAVLAGCGVAEEAEQYEPREVAEWESALTLPGYSSLSPLFGAMEGAPIVVSNNPESVNRQGLLLATEQQTLPSTVQTVRRTLSSTSLDAACPAGGMREFAFYMHHLNNLGANARYYVFIEPATAGAPVTFNAYGSAISQVDTGSLAPGVSPSYSVSLSLLTGTLPGWVATGAGSRFINVAGQTITGRYTLANLGAIENSSLDARIKVRSTNGGCLKLRVVAASATNATEQRAYDLSKQAFAWGNTSAPCVATSSAWGRPAGTYEFERWNGSTNVAITAASSLQGWRLLAAPGNVESGTSCTPAGTEPLGSGNNQRSRALGYYNTNTSGVTEGRDSDPYSTANYGAEYKLRYSVTNTSGQCVNAKLLLTSYPGQVSCSTTTDVRTRHWDGAARVTQDGVALSPVRLFTRCTTQPYTTIVSKQLNASQAVTWDVQFFVPGLISAPDGILLQSCPCGQTC